MMWLQAVPDTSNYLVAGYAVIFIAMALYIISIGLRTRRAVKTWKMYQDQVDSES